MIENLSIEEMQHNMNNFMEGWQKEEENRKKITFTPKKVIEETTIAPAFFHAEIDHLYQYGYEIPLQYIDEIKLLPRETLIRDLNAVIYDSIARFAVFGSGDWNDNESNSWFPLHALFILRDIQAEESLEVILDFMSQSEDFLEYWAGDMLTADVWSVVAMCGKGNLDRLSSFLKETGRYTYARSMVSEAVNQLAQHDIIPRQAAIDWLGDLLRYYIENEQLENLIDYSFNGLLVAVCLDLQAKELSPLIKQIFDAEMASEMIAGDWKEVEKKIDEPSYTHAYKREIDSIEEIYGAIKRRVSQSAKVIKNDRHDEVGSVLPDANKNYKIGRNDPCPCDSGKKYKKCHGAD